MRPWETVKLFFLETLRRNVRFKVSWNLHFDWKNFLGLPKFWQEKNPKVFYRNPVKNLQCVLEESVDIKTWALARKGHGLAFVHCSTLSKAFLFAVFKVKLNKMKNFVEECTYQISSRILVMTNQGHFFMNQIHINVWRCVHNRVWTLAQACNGL